MLLSVIMESDKEGESWMEDQWEKWLTHDISLDEFEDEDLSEITEIADECGMSLNCNSLDIRGHMTRESNSGAGKADGNVASKLQAEMLHLELIDAVGEIQGEEAALPTTEPTAKEIAPVTMDTYRPKRPTTLNLFPQVPRTQDTLNNNSLGKKYSWQEKVSHSSSPLKTGDLTPPHDHICLSEKEKVQHSSGHTKDKGTSTDGPCQRSLSTQSSGGTFSKVPDRPPPQPPVQGGKVSGVGEAHRERIRYHTDVCLEPTEEIYLTPVQKNSDPIEQDRPFLSQPSESNRMSVSSDAEGPPPYQPLPDRTNPSISEEDEVYQQAASTSTVTVLDVSARRPGHRRASEAQDDTFLGAEAGAARTSISSEASGLSYDSVKYTLVVDEHAQLELVSLRQCYQSYSDDSDSATVYDNCVSSPYESAVGEEYEEEETSSLRRDATCLSEDSTPEADLPFSRKFLNVFMNGRSRSSSAESFGLFSCFINGEERDQSHRAVFRMYTDCTSKSSIPNKGLEVMEPPSGAEKNPITCDFNLSEFQSSEEFLGKKNNVRFVPRHGDELELEVDDPLLVEVQAEDYWYEGYNMRTGARGIFPAYYAIEVAKEPESLKEQSSDWVDKFRVKFLGSVQVPYHKGNDILCAAMQKIATNRRMTVQFNPPSSCILEINIKGVKIVVQNDYRENKCSHFFQLKNMSFCGYHPKNNKYFGFITKHPADQRFACHVFVSEHSTKPLAESVGRAFQQFYKEFVEYTCPTEDIYLE